MRALKVFVAVALACLPACMAAGHHSSPWEFGGGVRVAPGFPLGQSHFTVHPMASYTYLSFDGGHDNLFELGAQLRYPLARSARHLWIGGEAAFSSLGTKISNSSLSYSTSGWSLTALGGVPVGRSRWGFNLYAGLGVSHYGSSGVNVRLGVDLQPWFLRPVKQ